MNRKLTHINERGKDMKMDYEEYFNSFEDIDNLKQAAKVWVKEDIRRLNERDDLIRELWNIHLRSDIDFDDSYLLMREKLADWLAAH